MFKFLQEKIEERRNKALIQSFFAPRAQFIAETKTIFLFHVHQELTGYSYAVDRISQRALYFRYGIAFAVVLLIIQGGTIAYANASDVGPTDPLYPMKRASETIQLQFASHQNKISLHKQFAHRRLKEIFAVENKGDDDDQTAHLNKDFGDEIRASFTEADEVNLSVQDQSELCNNVLTDIRSHEELFPEHGDHWQHIKVHCGETAETTEL